MKCVMGDVIMYGRMGGSCIEGGVGVVKSEICAACGKRFERRAEHAWRLKFKGKLRWYCSYTCMRRDEKPRLEAERIREAKKYAAKLPKTKLQRAAERVELCRVRYEQAMTLRRDAQAWKGMTRRQRNNLCNSVSHWLAQLTVAEQELEIAKRREERGG